MRRKLRRHFAFLMAVLMMLSLMGVQVLAEGVQVEAVQTTEGTDCTVLPEETDAEETSQSEMQKPDAKESPPESGVVTEEGKSTDSEKISVALKDEILTKGSLTADVSGTTESDQIAYQWQVSENGQWKDIEDTATVDSRKQSYEVARDGAQKTFRVKVTVNEAVTVYSSEYKVNYYDKLQNGSFETPKVSDAGTLTYKNINGKKQPYIQRTVEGKSVSCYVKLSQREQVLAEFEERGKLSEEKKRLLAYVDGLQNILKRNPYLNAGVGCGYQDFKDFACGRQFL